MRLFHKFLGFMSFRTRLTLALVATLLVPVTGLGVWDEVAALFRQTQYDEARELVRTDVESQPGQDMLWRLRLENDPEDALALINILKQNGALPEAMHIQIALQEASLQFARGNFEAALAPLEKLFAEARHTLPGELHLLAGLSYLALNRSQRSREAFASVPQSDPAFGWARYYLGYIGLEVGDVTLALRYFESAQRSDLAERIPSLLAGKWEGLRRDGHHTEAAELQKYIVDNYPSSLAMLRVHEILEREALNLAPASPESNRITVAVPDTPPRGRFSLQLAAFSDRSRALTYLAVWQENLPELRIDEEPWPGNQLLYKVRVGHFVSRAQASTEAQRLRRSHGLETIIVESGQ